MVIPCEFDRSKPASSLAELCRLAVGRLCLHVAEIPTRQADPFRAIVSITPSCMCEKSNYGQECGKSGDNRISLIAIPNPEQGRRFPDEVVLQGRVKCRAESLVTLEGGRTDVQLATIVLDPFFQKTGVVNCEDVGESSISYECQKTDELRHAPARIIVDVFKNDTSLGKEPRATPFRIAIPSADGKPRVSVSGPTNLAILAGMSKEELLNRFHKLHNMIKEVGITIDIDWQQVDRQQNKGVAHEVWLIEYCFMLHGSDFKRFRDAAKNGAQLDSDDIAEMKDLFGRNSLVRPGMSAGWLSQHSQVFRYVTNELTPADQGRGRPSQMGFDKAVDERSMENYLNEDAHEIDEDL